MEYNTIRNKLVIPEYGRNIQKMIEYAITIEDKEKRTNIAKFIVSIMGQMTSAGRDPGDFRRKLWDHLCIISDFKLDVDSPYPPPEKIIMKPGQNIMHKEGNNIRYRHYGKNIERIIEKAIEYEDGPEKDALIKTIANHMKKSYLNWNRESVVDEQIFQNLEQLSDKKLSIDSETKLSNTSDILARNKKKKQNGRQNPSSSQQGKGRKKQY